MYKEVLTSVVCPLRVQYQNQYTNQKKFSYPLLSGEQHDSLFTVAVDFDSLVSVLGNTVCGWLAVPTVISLES